MTPTPAQLRDEAKRLTHNYLAYRKAHPILPAELVQRNWIIAQLALLNLTAHPPKAKAAKKKARS